MTCLITNISKNVIARSETTKQSKLLSQNRDCFAWFGYAHHRSLAMTSPIFRVCQILLISCLLWTSGCQKAYYGTMEKFGYHKRDILVDRVEESKDAQEQAKEHRKLKAYDPENPPTYESEAAYLQRHGFLTDAEIKWLDKHPKALKPVIAEQHLDDDE